MERRIIFTLSSLFYKANRREVSAIAIGLGAVIVALGKKFSIYGILSVIFAFLVHETAHRQTARRMGCSSRFVLDPMGLAVTLISALLPIAFLAPGYVGINCWGLPITGKGIVRIAGSGPLSNIVMALVSLLLYLVGFKIIGVLSVTWLATFLYVFIIVNLWIAVFNLLPFPPLDGSKIFRVDRKTWTVMIAVAVALYVIALRL